MALGRFAGKEVGNCVLGVPVERDSPNPGVVAGGCP